MKDAPRSSNPETKELLESFFRIVTTINYQT